MWGADRPQGKPREVDQLPSCPESATEIVSFIDSCFGLISRFKTSSVSPFIQKNKGDSPSLTRKQEIEQTLKREFSKDIRALARLEELFFNLSFVSGQFRGDRGGLGGYLEVLSGLKEKVFLVEDEYAREYDERDDLFLLDYFRSLIRLMSSFCQIRYELSRVIQEYVFRDYSNEIQLYCSLIHRLSAFQGLQQEMRFDEAIHRNLLYLVESTVFQAHTWSQFFSVQRSIAQQNHTETVLMLFTLTQQLTELKKILKIPHKNTSNTNPNTPTLQRALFQLFSFSSAKTSLYFYKCWDPISASRLKSVQGHVAVEFVHSIENFAKTRGCFVSLVRQCLPDEVFQAGGYTFPWDDTKPESPKGLKMWPRLFTSPPDNSVVGGHWPNLVSIMMSFQKDLDTLDIIYYYDRADQVRSTYFCQKVEERMYIVIIFHKEKRKEGDSIITKFMNNICASLRYQTVFPM